METEEEELRRHLQNDGSMARSWKRRCQPCLRVLCSLARSAIAPEKDTRMIDQFDFLLVNLLESSTANTGQYYNFNGYICPMTMTDRVL